MGPLLHAPPLDIPQHRTPHVRYVPPPASAQGLPRPGNLRFTGGLAPLSRRRAPRPYGSARGCFEMQAVPRAAPGTRHSSRAPSRPRRRVEPLRDSPLINSPPPLFFFPRSSTSARRPLSSTLLPVVADHWPPRASKQEGPLGFPSSWLCTQILCTTRCLVVHTNPVHNEVSDCVHKSCAQRGVWLCTQILCTTRCLVQGRVLRMVTYGGF